MAIRWRYLAITWSAVVSGIHQRATWGRSNQRSTQARSSWFIARSDSMPSSYVVAVRGRLSSAGAGIVGSDIGLGLLLIRLELFIADPAHDRSQLRRWRPRPGSCAGARSCTPTTAGGSCTCLGLAPGPRAATAPEPALRPGPVLDLRERSAPPRSQTGDPPPDLEGIGCQLGRPRAIRSSIAAAAAPVVATAWSCRNVWR